MKKQITHVSPVQTAKVMGVVYFGAALPVILLMLIPALFAPGVHKPSLALLLGMPFLYGALGFVITIFGAWVYNIVTKYIGGIEYTSIEKPDA